MIRFPDCKINLGLSVVARRSDGFHDIESIFIRIPFLDVLEVVPSKDGQMHFDLSGIVVKGDPKHNICMEAFRLLDKDYDIGPVSVHLHKNIPTGAGLGGGSSDGACMLLLLNELLELNLTVGQLKDYAALLGSDCPFFIENKVAFVSGRGEILNEIQLAIEGKWIVVVNPGIHISTAEAFSMIKPARPLFSLSSVANLPPAEWKQHIVNDFEKSVCLLHPLIAEIKNELYEAGAFYASMSGSGSSVYGLFDDEPAAIPVLQKHNHWKGRI